MKFNNSIFSLFLTWLELGTREREPIKNRNLSYTQNVCTYNWEALGKINSPTCVKFRQSDQQQIEIIQLANVFSRAEEMHLNN